MGAAVALILFFAAVAGSCAFAIEYDESLHRFARPRVLRRGATSGLVAAIFSAVLAAFLIVVLFR